MVKIVHAVTRVLLMAALAAAPALALAQGAPAPNAPRHDVERSLAEVDAAWPRRDQPGVIDEMKAKLEGAEKQAPNDYGVLWRQARLYFWIADDPNIEKKEKSRLGKISWDYGDRASQADPKSVEGWNYAAAGMGNYALGIGVFTALRQGIEGKFKDRLGRATQIDPKFESGAIYTAWGRFWYELPWPKYDATKSRHALEEALKLNPDNVRAHVYLADLHTKEDRIDQARAELQKAVAAQPGRYDPPEERRWQDVARKKLAAPATPSKPEVSGG